MSKQKSTDDRENNQPSLIFASNSRRVGSISSHPSGYLTRLVFILGIIFSPENREINILKS